MSAGRSHFPPNNLPASLLSMNQPKMSTECQPAPLTGPGSTKIAKDVSLCSDQPASNPIMHDLAKNAIRLPSSTKMANIGSLCSKQPPSNPIMPETAQNVLRMPTSTSKRVTKHQDGKHWLILFQTTYLKPNKALHSPK